MKCWRWLLAWLGFRPASSGDEDRHIHELEERLMALDVEVSVQARQDRRKHGEKMRHAP